MLAANSPPVSKETSLASDPWRMRLRAAGAVLLVFLVLYGVRCVRKGWWEPPEPGAAEQRKRKNRGTDFTAYYSAGELARQGKDIFDFQRSSTPYRPYIYPPTFAVFPMAPLSLLPHNLALAVYFVLNVILLLVVLWLLRRLLWPEALGSPVDFWRRPEVGLTLAVLVCGRYLDSNFSLGQANVIVLFCLTLGLYGIVRERPFGGGLCVAMATAFKVSPGLFGLYLLWTWRRGAMLGGAVGLAVFLFLMPSVLLGFSGSADALQAFYRRAKEKLSAQPETPASEEPGAKAEVGWKRRGGEDEESSRAAGISLRGTLTKLLSPVVAASYGEGEDLRVNVMELDPRHAARIADALSLVLLGLTVFLTVRRRAREDLFGMVLSWGLVGATVLLIAPLTRKAHLVVLLIPAAALIAMLQQNMLEGKRRQAAWVGLGILGGAGLLTSTDIIGDRASEIAHAVGALTWATLAFYAALAVVLHEQPAAGAARGTLNDYKAS